MKLPQRQIILLLTRSFASASNNNRVWNPAKYLRFEGERLRPALDLLNQIPNEHVNRVVDLGCGTANMAPHFRMRWPNCEIYCVDSSEEMLETAKQSHRELAATTATTKTSASTDDINSNNNFDTAGIHYIHSTFENFASFSNESGKSMEFDVIFLNAALQWASAAEHATLLPRLLKALKSSGDGGGSLAFQMPDTRLQPSHLLMRTAAAELGLTRLLKKVRTPTTEEDPPFYFRLLQPPPGADRVEVHHNMWTTTYCHRLEVAGGGGGSDRDREKMNPVADFFASSGLGAYLEELPTAEQREAYVQRYRELIAKAYPKEVVDPGRNQHQTTTQLLLMKRFFCVATATTATT